MTLSVLIDPEAREELELAFDYYEVRQAGLGGQFAKARLEVFSKGSLLFPNYTNQSRGTSGRVLSQDSLTLFSTEWK